MRARTPLRVLLLVAALGVGLLAGGCGGEDEELEVIEGEPVELGNLSYNVSISRYLNPDDAEDRAYLVGQPELPNGRFWFGVFIQIENEGDSPEAIADELVVRDTLDNEYHPIPSQSLFALRLGSQVPAEGEVPEAETTAASGPIKGSMVLFQLDSEAIESRPLVLHITGPDHEVGEVELDI